MLQCGNLIIKVAVVEVAEDLPQPVIVEHIKASGTFLKVQAKAQRTWEEALEIVTLDKQRPMNSQHLLTLLRTGFHVGRIASLEELLNSILTDAIKALDAQRGSIILADPTTGELKLSWCCVHGWAVPASAGPTAGPWPTGPSPSANRSCAET